jgi:hypothetical protein
VGRQAETASLATAAARTRCPNEEVQELAFDDGLRWATIG